MTKWTIYGKDGKAKHESLTEYNSDGRIVRQDTLEYFGKWMGECFLTVSIKSAYPIDFQIGDYIDYRGERFTINYDPTVIKKARRGTYGEGFVYDSIKFNSLSDELTQVMFHDWVLSDNELHYTSLPNFSFYCKDVDDLVDRLQANTDRWCKANGRSADEYWMFYTLRNNTTGTDDIGQYQTTFQRTVQRAEDVLSCCGVASTDSAYSSFKTAVQANWTAAYGDPDASPSTYADSRDDERYDRNITASSQTVWDMMASIKSEFGLNFIIRGRNVYIGRAGIPTDHLFQYGKGKGLYEVDKTADQDQKIVTKLHAYGSDTNLPTRYYADLNKIPGFIVQDIDDVTEVAGEPRYFIETNITSSACFYGSNTNVTLKINDQTVKGVILIPYSGSYNWLFYTSPTYDTAANISTFMAMVAKNAIVYFTAGVHKSAFSSSDLYYIVRTDNLPDNMAVNFLMLPGFPNNSLDDICRAEYDEDNDATNYYITKPDSAGKVDTADEVLFHTEEGNHLLTFSADQYDPYILSPNVTELGVREGDISCTESNDDNGLEAVYPTIEEMTVSDAGIDSGDTRVDAIVAADKIKDNGVWPQDKTTEIPGFKIYLPELGFMLDDAISDAGGSECKISMKNGFCGGRTFDVVSAKEVQSSDEIKTNYPDAAWELSCKRSPDDDLDLYFPYSYAASVKSVSAQMADAYQILPGDNYVLTGIYVSDVNYVWAASVKLLRKAIHWLCKNDYTRYVFSPKIDEIYMAREAVQAAKNGTIPLHDSLKEGGVLTFSDEDLRLINAAVYIDQLTIKENGNNGIPTYEMTLRDEVQVGTLQRVQNQIDSLKTDIKSGNVTSNNGVTYTDVDPLVKAYGAKYFLSKTTDDTAQGSITVLGDHAVGGSQTVTGDATVGGSLTVGTSYGISSEGAARVSGITGKEWGVTHDGKATLKKSTLSDGWQTKNYTGDTLTDTGAATDKDGNMVANSIFARQFISAPKFVFNEINVTQAEQWNTNGHGTIEAVYVGTDEEGNALTGSDGTIRLHLEENEYGSPAVGDLCRGIYADFSSSASTVDGSDQCGFATHKGFFTSYFRVDSIVENEKGKFSFRYSKPKSSKYEASLDSAILKCGDPCAYMDFAQYGSDTDSARQSSMYMSSRGHNFIDSLEGVDDWVIQPEMHVSRFGWLGGITVRHTDGTYETLPSSFGLWARDHVYFGGAVIKLDNISDLTDLQQKVGQYDVSLSLYQGTVSVDDAGNVVGGLWTVGTDGGRQYRLSTTAYVRKGSDVLLEADGDDVGSGQYRMTASSDDCTVEVVNSTVYVKAIKNLLDGVSGGTLDESGLTAMRSMESAKVTITVDCEGVAAKTVEFPIRIVHDDRGKVFSTVFCRTNGTPSAPTGGSYSSPSDVSGTLTDTDGTEKAASWSDGIPSGGARLWASTRLFTSDGKSPQEEAWSEPRHLTDTADFDVCFHAGESHPAATPNNHGSQTDEADNGWHNEASADDVWMATDRCVNGDWQGWQVTRIKGERGDDAVRYTLTVKGTRHDGTSSASASYSTSGTSSASANIGTRGLTLIVFGKTGSLERQTTYDTYGTPSEYNAIIGDLTSLYDAGKVVAIVSYDAISLPLALQEELRNFGGADGMTCEASRTAYAFIGQYGLKEGTAYWSSATDSDVTLHASVIEGVLTPTGGTGATGEAGESAVSYGIDCSNPTPNVTDGDVLVTLTFWKRTGSGSREALPAGVSYTTSDTSKTVFDADTSSATLTMPRGGTSAVTVSVESSDGDALCSCTVQPIVNGLRGTRGAIIRKHWLSNGALNDIDFSEVSAFTFMQGQDDSGTTQAEEYVDFIYDVSGESWYRCKETYTTTVAPTLSQDTSALDSHWSLVSHFTELATDLLLAKDAHIDMMSGQEINLISGDKVWGSFRYVENDADYAFWLGGETGEEASLAVTRGGYLRTTGELATVDLGEGHVEICNGMMDIVNPAGRQANGYPDARFGYNTVTRLMELSFYKDGNLMYNLGPGGLDSSMTNDAECYIPNFKFWAEESDMTNTNELANINGNTLAFDSYSLLYYVAPRVGNAYIGDAAHGLTDNGGYTGAELTKALDKHYFPSSIQSADDLYNVAYDIINGNSLSGTAGYIMLEADRHGYYYDGSWVHRVYKLDEYGTASEYRLSSTGVLTAV